ncbi:MAG: hypothetical protein DBX59_09250 [Bacillota bacterium]|nr:MAG: hypothetical protein DBX59_09250 [Bacillota bacterium]
MVKSIVSILICFALIVGAAIYEHNFINRQFEEFNSAIECLYEKTREHTASRQDVVAAQENWRKKKEVLHAFIPHNDIKEMELWLAETLSLISYEKYEDALSKMDVLKELCLQIPTTYRLSLSNIF